jgi:F0F1-type ATP synthase delta subunit
MDGDDKKLTTLELVNVARFAAAYGTDIEDPEEYGEMVSSVLGRCGNKIQGIAYVMEATGDLIADIDAQRARAESVVKAQERKREFLDEWGHRLALEAHKLAQVAAQEHPTPEAWALLQHAREALSEASWRGLPVRLSSSPKAATDRELVWAHRTLSSLQGKGRTKLVVKALEQRDDPIMAARYVVMAAKRRAEFFEKKAKELEEARVEEEAIVTAAKTLIQDTLEARAEAANDRLEALLDGADGGEGVLAVLATMHELPKKERGKLKSRLALAIRNTPNPEAVRKAIDAADGADKHTDAAHGWARIVRTRRPKAVAADWDGTGRPKLPDVDSVPEEFVKTERTLRRKELVAALKKGPVEGAKLGETVSVSVRMSE